MVRWALVDMDCLSRGITDCKRQTIGLCLKSHQQTSFSFPSAFPTSRSHSTFSSCRGDEVAISSVDTPNKACHTSHKPAVQTCKGSQIPCVVGMKKNYQIPISQRRHHKCSPLQQQSQILDHYTSGQPIPFSCHCTHSSSCTGWIYPKPLPQFL